MQETTQCNTICSNTQCYDIGHIVCNTKSSGTQWLYKTLYIDDKQSKNCISFVLMKTCTAWTRAIQNRRLQCDAVYMLIACHWVQCSEQQCSVQYASLGCSAVCTWHQCRPGLNLVGGWPPNEDTGCSGEQRGMKRKASMFIRGGTPLMKT